ncbi:hypothetical protein WME89_13760 [Sorangium sp. So ce321]|uniref:hypothetical protein n=1 Tax=Sorangium sp. So ce321 TaxID=3133300 RepID=UPI003F619A10
MTVALASNNVPPASKLAPLGPLATGFGARLDLGRVQREDCLGKHVQTMSKFMGLAALLPSLIGCTAAAGDEGYRAG